MNVQDVIRTNWTPKPRAAVLSRWLDVLQHISPLLLPVHNILGDDVSDAETCADRYIKRLLVRCHILTSCFTHCSQSVKLTVYVSLFHTPSIT